MLKIRLRRVGAKKQPSYRIVVADSREPRDGRFIEAIGFYNPRTDPETVQVQEGRALHWLSVGAQPTETAARLLEKQGTLARFARLKAGEPLEALVAEAEADVKAQPASGITKRPVRATAKKEAEGRAAEEQAIEADLAESQGEEETEA